MFFGIPLSDIFGVLVAISLFVYISLDGFDLGIGILIPWAKESERDDMLASIEPFWDANETWLVLTGGLILAAFPRAQGEIFTSMYLPTALMLLGLLFRGAAFDFRAKGSLKHKNLWDCVFFGASLIVALAQGCMLGIFLSAGEHTTFAFLTSILSVSAYSMIGAAWLFLKTTGNLQMRSLKWGLYSMILGITSLFVVIILHREAWRFSTFELLCTCAGGTSLATAVLLHKTYLRYKDRMAWCPFVCIVILFAMTVTALAAHCYPWIICGKITLAEAAADEESLRVMLIGTLSSLPFIVFFHVAAHRIFKGKIRVDPHNES